MSSVSLSLASTDPLALKPQAAATSSSTSSTSSSASSQTSLSSLGQTFMTLLVHELQSQDPTAPMDTNAMVGQMISLNQLDQIASINQLLTNTLASGTTAGTASSHARSAAGAALAQVAAALQTPSPAQPLAANPQQNAVLNPSSF